MPPIRVLELRTTYGDGGGPDKTILLSAQQHNPDRVKVRCLYLRGAHDQAFSIGARARAMGVDYVEMLERGRVDLPAWSRVLVQVKHFKPHIIHAHDYKTDLLAWMLRPFLPGVRILATAHGWTLDNARMSFYNRLDRQILRQYPMVIAVSAETQARLLNAGLSPARVTVLYNGIDVETWKPGPSADAARSLKATLRLPGQARLLGFIGRLSPEKDVETALQVAQRVLTARPDVQLLVVGTGSEFAALAERVSRLELAPRIHLLGSRPVGPDLYQALSAYYLTSRTEGLPNTLLEAMACACPSVATAVGGIPELVGSSQGVLLRPAGDVAGLSQDLLQLLDDTSQSEALGKRARDRILQAFSFQDRLQRIESLYARLIGRPPFTELAPSGSGGSR